MEVTLCCGAGKCNKIAFTDDGVRIGEEDNFIKLTMDEWNALVEKIKSGELDA